MAGFSGMIDRSLLDPRAPYGPPGDAAMTCVLPSGPLTDGPGVPRQLRNALPLPEVISFHFSSNWRTDSHDIYAIWELLGHRTTLKHEVGENYLVLDDELWWREKQLEAAREFQRIRRSEKSFAAMHNPYAQTR